MSVGQLTSRSQLLRNGFWNLLGHSVPLLIGIVALPILIVQLGKERFGIISLGWALILWSGLLAQGISLALTKQISAISSSEERDEMPSLAGTAILLLFLFGLFEGLLLVGVAPWLNNSILNIPEPLRKESLAFFYILASLIPLANVSICLVGILEGQQKFRWINYVRIPTSFFILAGPLFILPFTRSLPWVLTIVLLVLSISVGAFWALAISIMPTKHFEIRLNKSTFRQLADFGKWIILGNALVLLMSNMPKFFIGALQSMTAVTYYATPYEVVNGLFIIPIALVQVMFPAFVASLKSDPQQVLKLYRVAFKSLFLIIFPVIFTIITFAPEGLSIWLGPDFAKSSGPILRWLALGIFIAASAYLPGVLIQASGRPDLLAKMQFIILPIFIMALFFSTKNYGIQGASVAVTGQFCIGGAVIFFLAKQIYPPLRGQNYRPVYFLATGVICFLVIVLLDNLMIRTGVWLSILFLYTFSIWKIISKSEERAVIAKEMQSLG
jgi:O-antigen/teichoic acid export membrane protein